MLGRAFRSLRRDPGFSVMAIAATGLAAGILSVLIGIERSARPVIPLPDVDRLVVFHISSPAGITERLATSQWRVIRDLPALENPFTYSIWPAMNREHPINLVLFDSAAPLTLDRNLAGLTPDRIAPSRLWLEHDVAPQLNEWTPDVVGPMAAEAFPLEPARPVHAWALLDALPRIEPGATFNAPTSGTSWLTVAAWLKPGVPAGDAAAAATQSLHAAGVLSAERSVVVLPASDWQPPSAAVPRPLLRIVRTIGSMVVISLAATVALIGVLRTIRESATYATEVRLGAELRHMALPRAVDWLLIAAGGTMLALFVAPVLRSVLVAVVPAAGAMASERTISAMALGFVSATLVTLPGMVYAVFIMRSSRLHAGGSAYGHTGRTTRRLFGLGLFAQFGVAAALIAVAVILAGALASAQRTDSGFTAQGAVIARVRQSTHHDPVSFRVLLEALRREPAIRHASVVSDVPLGDSSQVASVTSGGARYRAGLSQAGSDFVKALGARLIAGRDFEDQDLQDSMGAAVVNASLARQLAGDPVRALGLELSVRKKRYTVVGVLADGKYVQLSESATPFVYLSYPSADPEAAHVVVRGHGAAVAPLEHVIRGFAEKPGWPRLGPPLALGALLDKWLGPLKSVLDAARWLAPLVVAMSFFGALSVAVVVLVSGTRDLAIRQAVGATHKQAMRQHVWPYCRFALAGATSGLLLVAIAGQFGRDLLFGVNSLGVSVLSVTLGLLALTLVVAILLAMLSQRRLPLTLALEIRK